MFHNTINSFIICLDKEGALQEERIFIGGGIKMKKLRVFLVISVILLLVYFFYNVMYFYYKTPVSVDIDKPFNDLKKIAIEYKISYNSVLANVTTLLLGFLWVILLAIKTEISELKIKSPAEIFLFIVANISYILSLISNSKWKERIISSFWDLNIIELKDGKEIIRGPDIFCDHINAYADFQQHFFILGIITTAVLLLLAKFKITK